MARCVHVRIEAPAQQLNLLGGTVRQLSFYVKRWCPAANASYAAAGLDYYASQTSSLAYARRPTPSVMHRLTLCALLVG
jgi:hypothetical protein